MKKFFLLIMAVASFNANAALISITTDKDTYSVGETIMATVSGLIGLFLVQRQLMIGHPVQLEAEGTRLIQAQRRECLDGKIPSQVAMELPVVGISWVTVFR